MQKGMQYSLNAYGYLNICPQNVTFRLYFTNLGLILSGGGFFLKGCLVSNSLNIS